MASTPTPLAYGWAKMQDQYGDYYINLYTKQTSRIRPVEQDQNLQYEFPPPAPDDNNNNAPLSPSIQQQQMQQQLYNQQLYQQQLYQQQQYYYQQQQMLYNQQLSPQQIPQQFNSNNYPPPPLDQHPDFLNQNSGSNQHQQYNQNQNHKGHIQSVSAVSQSQSNSSESSETDESDDESSDVGTEYVDGDDDDDDDGDSDSATTATTVTTVATQSTVNTVVVKQQNIPKPPVSQKSNKFYAHFGAPSESQSFSLQQSRTSKKFEKPLMAHDASTDYLDEIQEEKEKQFQANNNNNNNDKNENGHNQHNYTDSKKMFTFHPIVPLQGNMIPDLPVFDEQEASQSLQFNNNNNNSNANNLSFDMEAIENNNSNNSNAQSQQSEKHLVGQSISMSKPIDLSKAPKPQINKQQSVIFGAMLDHSDKYQLLAQQDNWDMLVEGIEQNCALSDQYAVFKALRKVARNLLDDDEKYRTLYADNDTVQEKILGRVGGYEFLRGLGFKQSGDENELICQSVNVAVTKNALAAIQKKLSDLKKRRHEWDPKRKKEKAQKAKIRREEEMDEEQRQLEEALKLSQEQHIKDTLARQQKALDVVQQNRQKN